MDLINDRLSIKNLLFTKAIPNHEVPMVMIGQKIYPCTDCGDKFLFESSYEDHVNRKTMTITYMCRPCGHTKVFYNRCKLLCHIRSHTFKTATINVQDLKVEPLPLYMFRNPPNQMPDPTANNNEKGKRVTAANKKNTVAVVCYECKETLPGSGNAFTDKANHFMQYTNELYSCPVCLFTLSTVCGLRAHLRFHLKFPPYYCPECGVSIVNKNVHYPFNHDCEGFKMMRATARLKCPLPQCNLYHPNDFRDHMREAHIKKVYKCPICVVACFNEPTIQKHLKGHTMNTDAKAMIFYQCEFCPGKLVLQLHIETHLRTHVNANVFPCWTCGIVFKEVFALIDHHIKKHSVSSTVTKLLSAMVHESENQPGKPKRVYRVVKRCDQCKRNFTYKCKYNEIPVLPNECPYKCTPLLKQTINAEEDEQQITCHLCNTKIPSDWKMIKSHYAEIHKNYRCLEPTLRVERIDIKKYMKGNKKKAIKKDRHKRRLKIKSKTAPKEIVSVSVPKEVSGLSCGVCNEAFQDKQQLEEHMVSHRDPCMAYQCMECGQSFVVRPSFSKHLLLEHGISDAEEYIRKKQCFNENALEENQNTSDVPLEPLKENQCNICRDQFDNDEELKKHFRVHGMAFLLKNTSSKSP